MLPMRTSGQVVSSSVRRTDQCFISSETFGNVGWLSLVAISDVFCGLFCHLFELTSPVEIFDEGLGTAPVLLDLDEEFEEDTRAEEGFDLFAGSGSDALQH